MAVLQHIPYSDTVVNTHPFGNQLQALCLKYAMLADNQDLRLQDSASLILADALYFATAQLTRNVMTVCDERGLAKRAVLQVLRPNEFPVYLDYDGMAGETDLAVKMRVCEYTPHMSLRLLTKADRLQLSPVNVDQTLTLTNRLGLILANTLGNITYYRLSNARLSDAKAANG